MAVYKDNATGTWRVVFRFTNYKGERKQTQKRGFQTKREAQMWEREQLLKQESKLDMTFGSFFEIYEVEKNHAIYQQEKKLVTVKTELANTKGIFKEKQRKELQEQISSLESQIDNMKRYLSGIVQGYGYKTVKEFLAEYKMSKAEYSDYQSAVAKWEKETGQQAEADGIVAKLKVHQKKEKEQKQNVQHNRKKDRDAR